MKDFTKIAQATNIQDSPEMAILNRVNREWQQGKMQIEWEVLPHAYAKVREKVRIIGNILILMFILYGLFSTLAPLVPPVLAGKSNQMTMIGVFAVLSVIVEIFVAVLAFQYLRRIRWPAMLISIDRTARQVTIRNSFMDIQTVAYGAENVALPEFVLPENNLGQSVQLKDSLQSKITAETGLPFEKFENLMIQATNQ